MTDTAARVGIVMGSDSDWPVMKEAGEALAEFDVTFEADVVSAHRMPEEMFAWGKGAADRGIQVVIAGAGGAAHLPGMLASVTPLPVIGVPVALKYLDGMDSLLSIVQMPAGVPVATVAVGNARNAGLLAVRILAATDPELRQRMVDFQAELQSAGPGEGQDRARRRRRCPSARFLSSSTSSWSVPVPGAVSFVWPRCFLASSRRRCEPRVGWVGPSRRWRWSQGGAQQVGQPLAGRHPVAVLGAVLGGVHHEPAVDQPARSSWVSARRRWIRSGRRRRRRRTPARPGCRWC